MQGLLPHGLQQHALAVLRSDQRIHSQPLAIEHLNRAVAVEQFGDDPHQISLADTFRADQQEGCQRAARVAPRRDLRSVWFS